MSKGIDDPVAHELTVLALQCRDLAKVSENPELQRQLSLLAQDYEAAIASSQRSVAGFPTSACRRQASGDTGTP